MPNQASSQNDTTGRADRVFIQWTDLTTTALPGIGVETDHKPLECILWKPLHQAPIMLQRMIMSIQKYPITVCYKLGKELLVADALSRSPLPEEASELEFKKYSINILNSLPISDNKVE